MNLLDEIRYTFNKDNNAVRKIIIANVAVFLVCIIVNLFMFFADLGGEPVAMALRYFELPANLGTLLRQPWSILTYMFLHDLQSPFHILFNMLWLFWIGTILHEYIGNRKVYEAYFGGGLAGAVLFLICMNVFPVFANAVYYAYGASAGVLGVVVATATLLPNYPIRLLFLGEVKLKYIALISLLLDLIGITQSNAGGHIAHIGGALYGFVYIKYLYQDKYLLPAFIRNLFTKKSKVKIHYRTTYVKGENNAKPSQEEVDLILDKISKSGYDSLSKKEKEQLFKASND
jgi:membrane associated rhomboid family serine protease